MFRCARIQGLDTAEGLFLFGQEHFYVVDGVTLLSTKEIKDIDSLPQGYEFFSEVIVFSYSILNCLLKSLFQIHES